MNTRLLGLALCATTLLSFGTHAQNIQTMQQGVDSTMNSSGPTIPPSPTTTSLACAAGQVVTSVAGILVCTDYVSRSGSASTATRADSAARADHTPYADTATTMDSLSPGKTIDMSQVTGDLDGSRITGKVAQAGYADAAGSANWTDLGMRTISSVYSFYAHNVYQTTPTSSIHKSVTWTGTLSLTRGVMSYVEAELQNYPVDGIYHCWLDQADNNFMPIICGLDSLYVNGSGKWVARMWLNSRNPRSGTVTITGIYQ